MKRMFRDAIDVKYILKKVTYFKFSKFIPISRNAVKVDYVLHYNISL